MADRNLRYNIGAQDTASAVFDKVARSSAKAHKSMQGDMDKTSSKTRQVAQVFDSLADEVDRQVTDTAQAISRLEAAMGNDLSFSAREAFDTLQRGSLEASDVLEATDDDVDALVASLKKLDVAAQQAGGGIKRGIGEADAGMRSLHDSSDQSRSVLANMVGNSAQDLGELGGVVGTLGVGVGQLAEYAVDGNIALSNLAKVAGPLALVAVAGLSVNKVMEEQAKRAQRAKEIQEGYTEALLDNEHALAVTSETAKNFLDSQVIRRAQDFGANLDVLADSIVNEGDALDKLAGDLQRVFQSTAGPIISTRELADGFDMMGIATSPLTDELMRLAAAGELNQGTYRDLLDELQLLSDQYRGSVDDVEARRAIERALGTQIEETGEQAEKTGVQVDLMAAATQRASDAAAEAADELARANSELSDLFDISDSLPVIEDNLRQSLADAAAEAVSLAEANASGADKYSAFLDQIRSGAGQLDAYIETLREQGVSTEDAANYANAYIDSLFGLAGQFGVTEDQANDLRESMGLIPSEVTTTVNAVGAAETDAYLSAIAQHMAELDGMQATIRLRNEQFTTLDGKPLDLSWMNAGRRPGQKFAEGGTVQGPKGAEVDVTAHAGEIILNEAQQRNVADGLGGAMDTTLIESLLEEQNRLQRQLLSTLGDFVPRLSPRPSRS